MDEHTRYAFSSAADTSKQLVTLATGLLALEITFIKDVFSEPTNFDVWMVEASWVLLTLSMFTGLATLMALTGAAGQERAPRAADIYKANVKVPALLQVISFCIGVVLSVVFAIRGI